MPVISAVMAFHRDTPYLRPAIASVLGQTWRDLELVLVDNGTGVTPDALGEIGRDPRLRWIRLPRNEGIEVGYNAGFAAACGDFIALCDSDDIVLPHRFEAQANVLKAEPSIGLVSSLAECMDERGRMRARLMFTLPREEEHRPYALYADPLITPVTMGRRRIFAELPFRIEFPFTGNLDFWARATERTRTVVISEVHMLYRVYATQTTPTMFHVVERCRCSIQLMTARRRAGQPENMDQALQLAAAGSLGQAWRRVASQSLREGFCVLAAFQARRLFVLDRTAASALAATRLALAATLRAPARERPLVARMFFSGPLRALKLHPA